MTKEYLSTIEVGKHRIQLNIEEDLQEYSWEGAKWTSDKLIASSPFRKDSSPSFYVGLKGEYAGVWGDSGAIDDNMASGNYVKLIALLNNIDYIDAAEMLIEKYGVIYEKEENEEGTYYNLGVPSVDKLNEEVKLDDSTDSEDFLKSKEQFVESVSPYLSNVRGLSDMAQKMYGVGYDRNIKGFSAMAWRDPDGEVRNIKYRSTKGKMFFYAKGGKPVKDMVYGIHLTNGRKLDEVIICEAEIDAMSWNTAGYVALALGGSSISRTQLGIITAYCQTGKLLLAGDNDEQGQLFNERVKHYLVGLYDIRTIDYPQDVKDANDVLIKYGVNGIRALVETAKSDGLKIPRRTY